MLMYQVIRVYRWGTSDRVDVYSHHISGDKNEALAIFGDESKALISVAKEEGAIIFEDKNLLKVVWKSGAVESLGLNEVETSDGSLIIELNR